VARASSAAISARALSTAAGSLSSSSIATPTATSTASAGLANGDLSQMPVRDACPLSGVPDVLSAMRAPR
jgi:hypothetical protein